MKDFIENNPQIPAMVVAIVIGYVIGLISVYGFEEYGWTVFVVVPFFLGMIPTLLYGKKQEISANQAIKMGVYTLLIFVQPR